MKTEMARSQGLAGLGFGSVLRNKYFLRLWLAQIISQTIQNATNYGLIILLARASSLTVVGGVFIAFSLPAVIFGAPVGVLVDRFDKRSVLWVSNAARALLTFGFVLSLTISASAFLPIYLLTFCISIVGQFFGPAEGASIPLLVGEDDLVSALSLFNITFSISQALGLVIIAPLFILLAPTWTLPIGHTALILPSTYQLFLFIGALYLVCAALTASIPGERLVGQRAPSAAATGRSVASVWRDIAEAGNHVRADKRLFVAVLLLTLGNVIINIIGLIAPLFSQQFLHRPAAFAPLVFVPAGIGLVLGSALMPRIIDRIGLILAEAVGVVVVSACIMLLTFNHWIASLLNPHAWYSSWLYLCFTMLLAFCTGMALDLISLPAQTMLQRRSPDWMRGRILAFQTMLFNAVSIPVILIIGPIADFFHLPVAMNLMAATIAVLGLGCVYLAERYHSDATPLATLQMVQAVPVRPPAAPLSPAPQKSRYVRDAAAPSVRQPESRGDE